MLICPNGSQTRSAKQELDTRAVLPGSNTTGMVFFKWFGSFHILLESDIDIVDADKRKEIEILNLLRQMQQKICYANYKWGSVAAVNEKLVNICKI